MAEGRTKRSDARHPIGVVTRRTNLKPDLIRAWERRYSAVTPERTAGHHRLYSDTDIERLQLLDQAIQAGRTIGQVAHLDNQELQELIEEDQRAREPQRPTLINPAIPATVVQAKSSEEHLQLCFQAIKALDSVDLELRLERACVDLSRFDMLETVVSPMVHQLGESWRHGELRPVHENLTMAVLRGFLHNLSHGRRIDRAAPSAVFSTPLGQRREIGAMLSATVASEIGWRATYLGPDLPAEEIAAAAQQLCSRAVIMGIVYPADDGRMGSELQRLRRQLAQEVEVIASGQATDAFREVLRQSDILYLATLGQLRNHLGGQRLL
ncbi:MAG: MerR family transcriptional regulator [Acidobacteriota bacterium]